MHELEIIFRIFLGACCGIAIGYERRSHYKSAGVKTHMIVGMSSALMMIVSKYGFSDVLRFDAARVAAQAVSGVGFIGAGVILKKNFSVHGLTTAAGIFGTCGVGLAIGAGMYGVGVISAIFFIFFYEVVKHIDRFQNGIQNNYQIVFQEKTKMKDVLACCDSLKVINYTLKELSNGAIELDVTLIFDTPQEEKQWVDAMCSMENLTFFEKN